MVRMMENDKAVMKAVKCATIETFKTILPTNWITLRHTKSRDTIIHYAARYNRVDILKYIDEISRHRTSNEISGHHTSNFLNDIWETENVYGKRPLHEAAQTGSVDCVRFLIEQNVQVDALKQADWTPLMLACTQENCTVVKLLLEAGADLHLRNKDGWTSFHIACREGHIDIVSTLVDAQPSPIWLTASNNGRVPLHTIALHGHMSLAEWLIDSQYCPAPDTPDGCGSTPLMDAFRSGHLMLAKLLINRHGTSETTSDNLGRQSIHISAQVGCEESVKYLCAERNVDVNARCNDGSTPLHLAVWEGHRDIVEQLIHFGADPTLEDSRHRTALDTARLKNNHSIMELLETVCKQRNNNGT